MYEFLEGDLLIAAYGAGLYGIRLGATYGYRTAKRLICVRRQRAADGAEEALNQQLLASAARDDLLAAMFDSPNARMGDLENAQLLMSSPRATASELATCAYHLRHPNRESAAGTVPIIYPEVRPTRSREKPVTKLPSAFKTLPDFTILDDRDIDVYLRHLADKAGVLMKNCDTKVMQEAFSFLTGAQEAAEAAKGARREGAVQKLRDRKVNELARAHRAREQEQKAYDEQQKILASADPVFWVSVHAGEPSYEGPDDTEPTYHLPYGRQPVRDLGDQVRIKIPGGKYTHVGLWTEPEGGILLCRCAISVVRLEEPGELIITPTFDRQELLAVSKDAKYRQKKTGANFPWNELGKKTSDLQIDPATGELYFNERMRM